MQPRALGCKAKTGRFARHWHRTGRASPPEHHHRPHAGAVPNVPPPTGWNRSQFRFGSASEVSTFEGQVCITPMNGHRKFGWVASRNIGRQLGRAVDIPDVHPSEHDASQLLRWRQRLMLRPRRLTWEQEIQSISARSLKGPSCTETPIHWQEG
jgi:hypothetical protein